MLPDAGLLSMISPGDPAGLIRLAAAAFLVLAALHDLAVRAVPNTVVAMVAALGLALAAVQHRLLPSLLVATLLLALFALLWLRRYLGGADAKLFAAAGLLIAPANIPLLLLATALAGGLLSLPYLPGRRLFSRPAPGRPVSLLHRLLRCEHWRLRRRGPLPYAVAIAAGALFALFQGA